MDSNQLDNLMKERHPRLHKIEKRSAMVICLWAIGTIIIMLFLGGFGDIGANTEAGRAKLFYFAFSIPIFLLYYYANGVRGEVRKEWRNEHEPWISGKAVREFQQTYAPDVRRLVGAYGSVTLCLGLACVLILLAVTIQGDLDGYKRILDMDINHTLLWSFVAFSMTAMFSYSICQCILDDYTRRMITLLRSKEAI